MLRLKDLHSSALLQIALRKFSRPVVAAAGGGGLQPGQLAGEQPGQLAGEQDRPSRIDCGPKQIDAGKYKRNFFVNQEQQQLEAPSGSIDFR